MLAGALDGRLYDVGDVHPILLGLQRAGLDPGHIEQVGDEAAHATAFLLDRLQEIVAVLRRHTLAELAEAAQRQAMLAEQQKQQIAAAQQRVDTAAPQELSKEQIIAERERKKAEARAYQAAKAQPADEKTTSAVTAPDSTPDPRAAAVAAEVGVGHQ